MKTPKRETNGFEADYEPFDGPNKTANQCARWKRKNRVKQLKNTIRTLNSKLADTDILRIILRNFLISKRNAYILRSRNAETEQIRKDWLAATRDLNLFISLSYTPEELDAEANGQDPIPHALKFTPEERTILAALREEESSKQKESQQ